MRPEERLRGAPKCPSCYAVLDTATGVGPTPADKPSAGDLSVCLYCGAMLEFEAGCLGHALLSQAAFEALPADVRDLLRRVRTQVLALRDRRRA